MWDCSFRNVLVLLLACSTCSLSASPLPQFIETEFPEFPSKSLSHSVMRANFESQTAPQPSFYDAPTTSSCDTSVLSLEVAWIEPAGGVNSSSGIIITLGGISAANDCNRPFNPGDESWADNKNVIIGQVFYRNAAFIPYYDFGKYQVIDVLRGLNVLLEQYPGIDKRRLYLVGGSGGGHLALQTLQASPHLWAEVYAQSSITRITTPIEVTESYSNDPAMGWNVNLGYPLNQGVIPDDRWNRYQAERALRSPQNIVEHAAVFSLSANEHVPPVAIMHGNADEIVDFYHMEALREAVESYAGSPAIDSGNIATLGNWTFVTINGGIHSFIGAAPDENSRPKALNKYFPDAFTREKLQEPDMFLHTTFPVQHGYTYIFEGTDLGNVTVSVVQPPAYIQDWKDY